MHTSQRIKYGQLHEMNIKKTGELCEMCPNTEFFLVHIIPYSVRMQENTDQKKLRIWTLFTQW